MRRTMLSLMIALGACVEQDLEAPPAPRVEPVRSPTSLAKVWLRGTAEYGAAISVTRDPPFAAEEAPPALVADPFSARFEIQVALAPSAENTFVVKATDPSGNAGQPAVITVVHVPAAPSSIVVTLPDGPVVEIRGILNVRAQITVDEDLPLEGHEIRFVLVCDPATEGTNLTNAQGRVDVSILGFRGPSSCPVSAHSVVRPEISDYAQYTVGGPVGLRLTLAGGGRVDAARGVLEASAEISMNADVTRGGYRVHFALNGYEGTDAATDTVASTDATGLARVEIPGLTVEGGGVVRAWIEDFPLVDDALPFEVVGGAPASVTLLLSATVDGATITGDALTVRAGTDVNARVELRDGRGNRLDAPYGLSTDATGALFVGEALTRLRRAGEYSIVATVLGSAISAGASLTVTPAAPASASLQAPAQVEAGRRFAVAPLLADRYGNAVALASFDLSASDARSDEILDPARVTLFKSGERTLFAELVADGATDLFIAAAPIEVLPGPPARVTLALSGTDVDGASAGLQVAPPQSDLSALVVAYDAHLNVLDAPVVLTTDAPGILVGTSLRNTIRAGSYRVQATVTGTVVSTEASFDVRPGPLSRIALSLPAAEVSAGSSLQATAVPEDAFGNARPDTIAWALAPAGRITLSQLGLLDAAATGADGNTGTYAVSAFVGATHTEAALTVLPGAPASIDLTLGATAVSPGETIAFAYVVKDAQYNTVPSPRVNTFTDAPGAIMAAGLLTNLTVARLTPYTAIAQVAGTAIASTRSFSVSADLAQATVVSLSLASPSVPEDTPLPYDVSVTDGFGNAIDAGTDLEVFTTPATSIVDRGARTLVFQEATTYTVTARVARTGALDSENVYAFRPFDAEPPQVSIELPAAGASYVPGSTVTARVLARDDRGLAQIELQIRGVLQYQDRAFIPAAAGSDARTEVLTFAIPAGTRYGDIRVEALAIDSAGNVGVAQSVAARVAPVLAPGYTASTVAIGLESGLNTPQGVAHGRGMIYVANFGDFSLRQIDPATGEILALDGGFAQRPQDLAYRAEASLADDRLYLSFRSSGAAGRIDSYDIAGNVTSLDEGADFPSYRGVAWLAGRGLFGADSGNNRTRRFDTSDPPVFQANLASGADNQTWGVAVRAESSGNHVLFTSHAGNNTVRQDEYTAADAPVSGVILLDATHGLAGPRDVALVPGSVAGDTRIVVANRDAGTLLRVNVTACAAALCPPSAVTIVAAQLRRPVGLEFIDATRLLVTDEVRNEVFLLEGPF